MSGQVLVQLPVQERFTRISIKNEFNSAILKRKAASLLYFRCKSRSLRNKDRVNALLKSQKVLVLITAIIVWRPENRSIAVRRSAVRSLRRMCYDWPCHRNSQKDFLS